MLFRDSAVATYFRDICIDFQYSVQYEASAIAEKDYIPRSKLPCLAGGFQHDRVPVAAYKRQHADTFHGNSHIMPVAKHTEDFPEKYFIADNDFFHITPDRWQPDDKFTKKHYLCILRVLIGRTSNNYRK